MLLSGDAKNLVELIFYREYEQLETSVNLYLKNHSWNDFCQLMENANNSGFENDVPYGKIRDAVVFLLGLEPTSGIDADLIDVFHDLPGYTVEELRDEAVPVTVDHLRKQIPQNTYFINVEKMKSSQYAVLVDDVVKSRKKELQDLEEDARLRDILATYYGFTMLTTSMLLESSDEIWKTIHKYSGTYGRDLSAVTETASKAFSKLCERLEIDIDFRKQDQVLGSNVLISSEVSKELRMLMGNIITMAFSGSHDYKQRSITALGETGDSRAVPFLHLKKETVSRKNERHLVAALRDIGHPSSVDVLCEYANGRKWRLGLLALEGLGNIRCGDSLKAIVAKLNSRRQADRKAALSALCHQRNPKAVNHIVPFLSDTRYFEESLKALMKIDPEGKRAIINNAGVVLPSIIKHKETSTLLRMLKADNGLKPLFSIGFAQHILPFLSDSNHLTGSLEVLMSVGPAGKQIILDNAHAIWSTIPKQDEPDKLFDMLKGDDELATMFSENPCKVCESLVTAIVNQERTGGRYHRIHSMYTHLDDLLVSLPEDLREPEIAGLARCTVRALAECRDPRLILSALEHTDSRIYNHQEFIDGLDVFLKRVIVSQIAALIAKHPMLAVEAIREIVEQNASWKDSYI